MYALLANAFTATAQDIHFSQFANSPLNLNPGLTGVFGGDLRAVANYRNQWRTVPVPYLTFSGSVENKFYYRRDSFDRYLTGGFLFSYDRQGSLDLRSVRLGIPISWTIPLTRDRNNFLTLAIAPLVGQRSFGVKNARVDAQWDGAQFQPGMSLNEPYLLNNNSITYFDLSAGANYRIQASNARTRFDFGVGWQHINRPEHDFWSGDLNRPGNLRLASRYSFYGVGLYELNPRIDLVGQALYQRQGGYQELVYGAGARVLFNLDKPYHEWGIQGGFDFRHRYRDAIIPHVEFIWRTWVLGVTYDMNAWKDVRYLTNWRGGLELAISYRLYKLKMPAYKSCGTL